VSRGTLSVIGPKPICDQLEAVPFDREWRAVSQPAPRATLTVWRSAFTIAAGLFWQAGDALLAEDSEENKSPIDIESCETEQIADRPKFSFELQSEISDDPGYVFFGRQRKILPLRSTIALCMLRIHHVE